MKKMPSCEEKLTGYCSSTHGSGNDVSTDEIQRALRTNSAELTQPWRARNGPATQRLGLACFESGRFSALRYRSTKATPSYCLAVFPNRMDSAEYVSLLDPQEFFSQIQLTSTSSHKWETYRRRRFGRFSRRRATSILRSVRKERATQKIGQSAIGPPGWLEKGPSASLLARHGSQRIRSSLAPSIQTLLKPTVCLPLMRRCTSSEEI